MITRPHRFHGHNSLRHVYSRGQIVRSPELAIKFLRNDRRSTYRVAVVVSRKVHKSAVVRNRIRRRIYEIIRGQVDATMQPYDIVITVFSDVIATMEAAQLQALIAAQLRKADIVSSDTRTGQREGTPRAIVKSKERL